MNEFLARTLSAFKPSMKNDVIKLVKFDFTSTQTRYDAEVCDLCTYDGHMPLEYL